MKTTGVPLSGVETGNGWQLHSPGHPTNWIVGETSQIDPSSLRHVRQAGAAHDAQPIANLAVKWFQHDPQTDDPAWGSQKPTSTGRTLSLLASGGPFALSFGRAGRDETFEVVLDVPGDFVIWGAGLEHRWQPLALATVVTIRWELGGD